MIAPMLKSELKVHAATNILNAALLSPVTVMVPTANHTIETGIDIFKIKVLKVRES